VEADFYSDSAVRKTLTAGDGERSGSPGSCDCRLRVLFDAARHAFSGRVTATPSSTRSSLAGAAPGATNLQRDELATNRPEGSALNDEPPPSLEELRRQLGYSCSTVLKKHFPGLCDEASTRRRSHRRQKILELTNALQSALSDIPALSLVSLCKTLNTPEHILEKLCPRECASIRARYRHARGDTSARRKETVSTRGSPNNPEHARRWHIPDYQAGENYAQSKKQLGGGLHCSSKGTKGVQGDHVDVLVAAIPSNSPTKIDTAALSR
jgi:hypothetical protein